MKITFFINTLSSGGAEHQLSTLANLLIEKEYDIEIVTYGDVDDHYKIHKDIKRIKIGFGKNKFLKFFSILNFFRAHKTDVFISYCQQNNFLAGIGLILGFRRTHFVASERNFTIGKSSILETILLKLIYRRANYVIPNSYSQSNYILSKSPKLKNKVRTIINYTDLSIYKPTNSLKNNDKVFFCVVARYDAQKNYKNFAFAISQLKKNGLKFHVDWYGAKYFGSQLRKEYLDFIQLTKDLDIEDVITLNDSQQKVAQLLVRYDFFCLPSLFEGFSNSISEAICCGLPVVASNVSDNVLMVRDGLNGYLFNPNDISEIELRLAEMIQLPPEEKIKMGAQSRIISEKLFNKERFIQDYLEILK